MMSLMVKSKAVFKSLLFVFNALIMYFILFCANLITNGGCFKFNQTNQINNIKMDSQNYASLSEEI